MVRFWSWLSLCVLVKARTSVICPLSEADAVSEFNIYCSTNNPCANVDVYCPSHARTDLLWMDCNGPHACVNVSVYSSMSTRVRCRGRTGACENFEYFCGDVQSIATERSLENAFLFDEVEGASSSAPISCKFRHLTPRATRGAVFGCYGDKLEECTLKSTEEYAFTNSLMRCETTNGVPCVMSCLTSSGCADNQFECAADPGQCQCEPSENCASVELDWITDTPATTTFVETTTTIVETTATTVETTTTAVETTTTAVETTSVETTSRIETTQTATTTMESTDLPPEAREPNNYYVSMESNDYLNEMILAANRCNTYQGQSFKANCIDSDTGVNTGFTEYFSDEDCTEPMTNSDANEYTCIIINNEKQTQVASITRYTLEGANTCTNKEAVIASAVERSTYYLSVDNCATHGNEGNAWHRYACNEGVLVHSLYNANDCHAESLISSDSFSNGECYVEEGDAQTHYWQINCTVRGDLTSTTTSQAPESSTTTTAPETTTGETTSVTETTTAPSTTEHTHSTTSISTTSVATTTTEEQTTSTRETETTSVSTSTSETESTSTSTSTSGPATTSTSTTDQIVETTPGADQAYQTSKKTISEWQLILVIVLSCVIAILGCIVTVCVIQRLRKADKPKVNNSGDLSVSKPLVNQNDAEHSSEDRHKSVSAQSRIIISPTEGDKPLTGMTLPTPSEGDKSEQIGVTTLVSPPAPSEGDKTGKPGVDQV